MFLVDGNLVCSRSGAIVSGFDNEKVHAEEDRDEDQGGDTESSFKGNVLDDSTSDCLAKTGSVRECDERGGEKLTREAHQRPTCSPRLLSEYLFDGQSTCRILWR